MSASLLNQGKIRGEFALEVENSIHNMRVDDLAVRASTESNLARFGFLQQVAEPRRRSGPKGSERSVAHRIEILNERWDAAENVKNQDWINDETGMTRSIAGQLGESFGNLMFKGIMDLAVLGETENSYDEVPFYSASHYGTQTNLLTSTEVPALDVTVAAAPTPEEMVDAIVGVIGRMMGFKDHRARPMNENARKFIIAVPAENMFAPAITAVKANQLSGGQTSVIATLNEQDYEISIVATPRLTVDEEIHVFRVDAARTKPFIISENIPVDIQILDESSDQWKKDKTFGFIGDWYGGFGFGEPLYAAKATFS